MIAAWLVSLLTVAGAAAAELRSATLTKPGLVPDALIVGRATCGWKSWLLTETPELIEIKIGVWTPAIRPIGGLKPAERVWGLACLSDGSLWTLATPRTVARIEPGGQIVERVDVVLPRIAVFGAGDRLLFQQLPLAPGAAALATSPPRQPQTVHAWPGLIGRTARTREDQLARNLVNCGIGVAALVPCWFADDRQFTVSDGSNGRRIGFAPLSSANVDSAAPIWDVALVDANRFWLLTSAPRRSATRTGGGRLYWSDTGRPLLALDLTPLARVVVTASETRCVVVTIAGALMEIGVTR
ncbi:MAG: hypothetical protein HY048_01870 [Acidobacteria bacterium]|nr:hypothetical protein [Acidobacteriota bacterium]